MKCGWEGLSEGWEVIDSQMVDEKTTVTAAEWKCDCGATNRMKQTVIEERWFDD